MSPSSLVINRNLSLKPLINYASFMLLSKVLDHVKVFGMNRNGIFAHCRVITGLNYDCSRDQVYGGFCFSRELEHIWRTVLLLHGQRGVKKDHTKKTAALTEEFGTSCCHDTAFPNYSVANARTLTCCRQDSLNVLRGHFICEKTKLCLYC